jgi:uncharacterized damage-inducible protein DinB
MAKAQTESLLTQRWEQASRKLDRLADLLPEDKLDWRPAPSIRTVGDVLRHAAFWNQYLADSLRGKPANDSANELPACDYATKASVLQALRTTAGDVAAALRETDSDSAATELVLGFLEHTAEHYGQLVVYSRLLGIAPPSAH